MKSYLKMMLKILLWMLIFGFLFVGLNFLAQPVWLDWNNYDTVQGFYEEPEDTIEVIFLGTSSVVNSIMPMELYEDYGICAYNLGTEQQPIMASYYWLEEAYRKHSKTLTTVVLDTSALRFYQESAFYRKAIDRMEVSSIKYRAVKDYADKSGETIADMFPLYTYHDRWKSFNVTDFQKARYTANTCVRGYNFTTGRYLDTEAVLQLPLYLVDDDAQEVILNTEAIYFFGKMVDFCKTNGLNLVPVRLAPWQFSEHNAVKSKAEEYNLELLDFSFDPLFSEIEFNLATDTGDPNYSNYYGAKKLTKYIGNYLKTKYRLTDVRDDKKYSYMKEQLKRYHALVSDVIKIKEMTDPKEYLSLALSNKNYTIFIMGKVDAANALTQEQRDDFAVMGLTELSTLSFQDSYLAVYDRGRLICEQIERCKNIDDDAIESAALSYKGNLDGGPEYLLESGGALMGNKASCLIDGNEYAKNERGLNIVVYDNRTEKIVDSTCFDTYASDVRDGENLEAALRNAEENGKRYSQLSAELKKLYLYNRRCENAKKTAYLKQSITEDGFLTYLSAYREEDYIIYLSVMDEAAGAMDMSARTCLADYGLTELSALEWRDSYLGMINSGKVVYERRDHGNESIATRYIGHVLESGGCESNDCHSSVVIDGVEYSPNSRGINIVVYDTLTKSVVDTAVFDTCVTPIKVPDDEEEIQ